MSLSFLLSPVFQVKQRRSADHRLIKFETLGSDTVADVRLCTHTHCQSTAVNYFESQLPSLLQTHGQSELNWACNIIVSSGGLVNDNYTESLNSYRIDAQTIESHSYLIFFNSKLFL